MTDQQSNYKKKILAILSERDPEKTMCPSETLAVSEKKNPEMMEAVRTAARQLVKEGKIEILQKGRVIDPDQIHGPIRLKLKS